MWTALFDIDGTLIRSGGAGLRAIERVLCRRFQTKHVPTVTLHGRTDVGIWHELLETLQLDVPADLDPFFEEYCVYLKEEMDRNRGKELPGCRDLLKELHQSNKVRAGLLTGNVERAAWIKMHVFGLDRYLEDFGGFGNRFADRNQVAEEAWQSAKNRLGNQFDPSKVLVIGDTVRDIECGRHIDATVVAVATGGESKDAIIDAEPDYFFNDLSDCRAFLAIIES